MGSLRWAVSDWEVMECLNFSSVSLRESEHKKETLSSMLCDCEYEYKNKVVRKREVYIISSEQSHRSPVSVAVCLLVQIVIAIAIT